MLVKNIKVFGEIMKFKIGDKVKIDQNYDKERFKHFVPAAIRYRDEVGTVAEAKISKVIPINKIVETYVVRWGIGTKSILVDDMLKLVDEKYKSIW